MISGETKTSWWVDGSLYNKRGLSLRGGGDWSRAYIEPYDEEAEMNKYRPQRIRMRILRTIQMTKFDELPLESLREIYEIIQGVPTDG